MEISPILLSLKTATVAIFFTFVLGTLCAYGVFNIKQSKIKTLINSLCTLPLVLPPTVFGFMLLEVFGVGQPLGNFLLEFFGVKVVFSWTATVIAAVAVSFPLMYRSAYTAFQEIDSDIVAVASTLGLSKLKIFIKLELPLAKSGLLSGGILSFARGLGEFGATTMLAGNIVGKTRTLPLAIYSAVAGGNNELAKKYVLVILSICLVIILIMEWITSINGRGIKK